MTPEEYARHLRDKRNREDVAAGAALGCSVLLARLGCFVVLVLIAALIFKAVMR